MDNATAVVGVCAVVGGLVFWVADRPWAAVVFRWVPPVLFVYYLPSVLVSLHVLPRQSEGYIWMREVLLPFSLFLLLSTTDLRAVLRVGPKALSVMLAGSVGVIVGGPVAYLLTRSWLPEEAWQGLAALAGSWIGGSGNFAAVKEAVGAPDALVGPLIIVDTAIAYTWMGVLLFLARYQAELDRWNRADTTLLTKLIEKLEQEKKVAPAEVTVPGMLLLIGFGLTGAVGSRRLGEAVYGRVEPWLEQAFPLMAGVFSSYTWMVLVLTTAGAILSLTPVRRIERLGASRLGYSALYVFLASLGAKADLSGLAAAPALLLTGVIWMLIHVLFISTAARWLRAPVLLAAAGSQANIGGVATAPVVAAAYHPMMAPLGLLLGIAGYLIGNYGALLCAAFLRYIA